MFMLKVAKQVIQLQLKERETMAIGKNIEYG